MPLSLIEASEVIEKAHARAAQLGIKVTVAVVDEGGLLIALSRMDGAAPISPQLAEAKAVGAAMLLRDGGALAQLAQDRPGFFPSSCWRSLSSACAIFTIAGARVPHGLSEPIDPRSSRR